MITKILLGVLLSAGTLSAGATSAGESGVLAKIEAVPGHLLSHKVSGDSREHLETGAPCP